MFAEFGVLNYLTYLVGAIFIILVPGPNTFFVLKTGIAHGVKKGYLAAAGVFIGDAVLMLLAFAGVATLIKTTPVLFNIVRYLGAIYLLWLGGKMLYSVLTQREGHADAGAEPASFAVSFILRMARLWHQRCRKGSCVTVTRKMSWARDNA